MPGIKRRGPFQVQRHLARQFFLLTKGKKRIHLEAVVELYMARLRVLFSPAASYLPSSSEEPPPIPETDPSSPPDPTITDVSRAVTVMARYLPGKLVCLPQALAARRMLVRRGYPSEMYLGVRYDENGKFEAHAWLRSTQTIVTGGEISPQFVPLVTFHHRIKDPIGKK